MTKNINPEKYAGLIRKIKTKKTIVIVLMAVASLAVLVFGSPLYINIGGVFIDREGLPIFVAILLVVLILISAIIANAFVVYPVFSSLDVECDPEKHFVLNNALNRQKSMDYIHTVDFLYMGDFAASLGCAERMVASAKPDMVRVGWFNLARCHFFMGNTEALEFAADSYGKLLAKDKKLKPEYLKLWSVINLMVAFSKEDKERIASLRKIEPWNKSKATEGFVNYLLGLAAYELGETQEAIYRFGAVKDFCSKTVFAELSQEYLDKLK